MTRYFNYKNGNYHQEMLQKTIYLGYLPCNTVNSPYFICSLSFVSFNISKVKGRNSS